MATYSETEFNSTHYGSARPTYPDKFYETLVDYHTSTPGNVTDLAMDVGCGPGFVAFKLTKFFRRVVGTDPSSTMIKECEEILKQTRMAPDNVTFCEASGEKAPSWIQPESVDMITVAEACHWMDHSEFFAESARVLKKGGTLAYWFYLEPYFVGNEKASQIHERFSFGSSLNDPSHKGRADYEHYIGPYYEQPGHDLYRDGMAGVTVPDAFENVIRHYYHPEKHGPKHTTLYIEKKLTMKTYEALARSWSGYHNWKKANPDKPDAVDELVADMRAALGVADDETPIDVIFPTVYTFARKKGQARYIARNSAFLNAKEQFFNYLPLIVCAVPIVLLFFLFMGLLS